MTPFRIVLADDHTLVRAGIRKLLESIPAVEVVGEADDGRKVLALVEQLKPDVVLMDLSMPGLTGLEATARLKKSWPKIRVMVLSMHQNEEYVRQAWRSGAVAYLLKDAAPQELELALQAVLRGETYLSPSLATNVPELTAQLQGHPTTDQLTPRQTEVLRMVAQGFSSKEIAREMDLSVKTVETHRTNLMKQLDIHEVTGLVRYAIRKGLIPSGL
jgi:DNA-binding NarL/FixJ family response regulator